MKKLIAIKLILLVIIFLTACKKDLNNISNETNTNINETSTGIQKQVLEGFYSNVEELISLGKYEDALKILEKEYKEDDKNIDILRYLGNLKMKEKKYEEALKYFLKADNITNGQNSYVLYDIGITYSWLGKIDISKKYINESLKINPNNNYAKEYLKYLEEWK